MNYKFEEKTSSRLNLVRCQQRSIQIIKTSSRIKPDEVPTMVGPNQKTSSPIKPGEVLTMFFPREMLDCLQ